MKEKTNQKNEVNNSIYYEWKDLIEWCEKLNLNYEETKNKILQEWQTIENALELYNKNWEQQYLNLWKEILKNWDLRETRNSKTLSLFWKKLQINCLEDWNFPLVTSRKMFPKSFVWEYAAFLRWPKSVEDFEKFGCWYWDLWKEKDWSINVDYWNEWINSNWTNQIDYVLNLLKNDPNSRRMIIDAWNPSHIWKLSLECCHFAYQFYVRDWHLDILWNQRSADYFVWVPSDIGLAALMLITIWAEVNLKPGRITMIFWDTHVYESHIKKATEHIERNPLKSPKYEYKHNWLYNFMPEDIKITDYENLEKIKYDLIG